MKSCPRQHLDEFQKRCTAVRDLVHHVVTNEDVYGFYLWGPQGCGKSTGIERALDELEKTPILFRGSMTDQSLFTEAKAHPHGILWINDDPELLTKPAAQQYLLAMLEDTTDPKTAKSYRLVTKSRVRANDDDRFKFWGRSSSTAISRLPVTGVAEPSKPLKTGSLSTTSAPLKQKSPPFSNTWQA